MITRNRHRLRYRVHWFLMIALSVAMWGALRIATGFPTTTSIRSFPSTISKSSSPTALPRMLLFMAKGDGKQRRPKKTPEGTAPLSSAVPSSNTPPSSSIVPQRVSNHINIPIRHQIRYGRLNKALREQEQQQHHTSSNSGGSFNPLSSSNNNKKIVRTKYRRKWNEEEIQEAAQARRRKGQDPNWEVVWNQTKAAPLVIVDGYNIIYQWSRLKKHMTNGDTARARQLLVDDLENLRSNKGWRIEVVFDGAGRRGSRSSSTGSGTSSGSSRSSTGGPPLGDSRRPVALTAADRAITKDVSKYGVRIIYTGSGIEADSYIEERCTRAKNVTQGRKTGMLIVATDDAMIRIAGESAGALCMSADRFVTELKAVKQIVAHRVEAAMAKVNGQPMRPEKLWGTNIHLPRSTAPPTVAATVSNTKSTSTTPFDTTGNTSDVSTIATAVAPVKGAQQVEEGKFVYRGRFGRGNLIIEDKRKPKKS